MRGSCSVDCTRQPEQLKALPGKQPDEFRSRWWRLSAILRCPGSAQGGDRLAVRAADHDTTMKQRASADVQGVREVGEWSLRMRLAMPA